jgi:hypothetical protein
VGCDTKTDVKVYEDTEDVTVTHVEVERTAVVTGIDLETNVISFKDCINSEDFQLIYHGGVSVLNTYGRDIGIGGIGNGSVVDVFYYSDTEKIVSITVNDPYSVGFGEDIYLVSVNKDNNYCILQIVREPWRYFALAGIVMLIAGAFMLFIKGPRR